MRIYIQSYDRYNEILDYRLPEGTFAILLKDDWAALGIPLTMGRFCSEGKQVAGVFASPEGPVFFLDGRHLVGQFGATSARSEKLAGQTKRRYLLSHRELSGKEIEFGLVYEQRLGIGANPYDNEEEDIDLLAMIASNIRHEAFFRAYTKPWVNQ